MMWARWLTTVLKLIPSCRAIFLLDSPSAINTRISVSRGVRCSWLAPAGTESNCFQAPLPRCDIFPLPISFAVHPSPAAALDKNYLTVSLPLVLSLMRGRGFARYLAHEAGGRSAI